MAEEAGCGHLCCPYSLLDRQKGSKSSQDWARDRRAPGNHALGSWLPFAILGTLQWETGRCWLYRVLVRRGSRYRGCSCAGTHSDRKGRQLYYPELEGN